jgi:YegS/Rv2252/BmrU family lipid kinase
MKKRILIIANPIAGRAGAERSARKLFDFLNVSRTPVELFFTREKGDARKRACEVGSKVRAVVVAGGDGTVSEVLNGLPDPGRTPMAILPTGTANMLARELELPGNPEQVADMLRDGAVKHVDMGLVESKRFLLLVSAGFDAMVTQEVSRTRAGALGYRGYLVPIVKVVGKYKRPELKISVDGKQATGGLVMVFSIRNYGGLFEIDAVAGHDSGRLDVFVFHGGDLPSVLRYSVALVTQKIPQLPDVTFLSGRNIRIEGKNGPVPVEVDGDYFGTTPVNITLKPALVPIIVPK